MLRNTSRKRLADELARQICRNGADEFARLFNFTGLVAGDTTQARKPDVTPAEANHIGIWRKDEGGNEFVRDVDLSADWPYWAQLPSFPLHSAKRRVLLLGESAARGMFYDPGFTPAQVLASLLQAELGDNEVEVLDFARTNAAGAHIQAVAESSLQLKPDAVVIFAGNNWVGNRSYLDAGEHLYDLAESFRSGGAAALRSALEQRLKQKIVELVDAVGATYSTAAIPVYWIIPEFNLLDWRDPAITSHWLDGEDENRQWSDLRSVAESQLRDKEYPRCLKTAEAMLALDKGQCSTTLYLLADCHGALGQRALQREYLERARDAFIVDSTRAYSPRIPNFVRETLHQQLVATGQKYVDLKELFADYLQGEIPGRRMFLDYCHLTSEAIGVSMAGIAQRLLAEIFRKDGVARRSLENVLSPSQKIGADAYLLAAIHNAHWGQSLDVVTHYCMQAVEKSADVLEIMRVFADLQNRRAPTWMNAQVVEVLESLSHQVKRYLFSMEYKCLDRLLLKAFEICCRKHGMPLTQELAAVRQEQHSVQALGRVDLLDPYYHSASFSNQQLIEDGFDQRNNFFKAYEPVSYFCMVADNSGDLWADVTLRVSSWVKPEAEVDIWVNGNRALAVKPGNEWQSCRFKIPKTFLSNGINKITVTWPGLAKGCAAPLEQICADIQRHHIPRVYPTYGDIFSMTVQQR